MAWMKLFGASGFALASTAGRVGNPIAALVGSTRSARRFWCPRRSSRSCSPSWSSSPSSSSSPSELLSLGQTLASGSVPFITQLRKWVGRERPWAVVVAAALGDVAPVDVEAAGAAAVRAAPEVVPANVVRQRDVLLRVRADPSRGQLLPPGLGSTEMLDDLRARLALLATIEDPLGGQTADMIGVLGPPQGAFAA